MTYGANAPNGLVPVNTGNGNTWNGQTTTYPITATYGTAMFTGDPVTLGTAGTVIVAVASQSVLGVFQGCEYQISANPYTIRFPYWPGNPGVRTGTSAVAYVIDDPQVRFTVQEATATTGASGTPLTQAVIGNNANIVLSTGNTNTGQSRAYLDNSTTATTLLGMVKIVALDPGITLGVASTSGTAGGQQTIGTAFQNWIVTIDNSVYKAGSTRP